MGIFGKTGSFWFHSKHAVGGTSPLGHSPVEGLLLLHPGLPSHTCRGTCWAGGRRVNGLLFWIHGQLSVFRLGEASPSF